jgi:hypothetical protein
MRVRLPLPLALLALVSLVPSARAQQGCPLGSCALAAFPAVGPIVLEGGDQGALLFSMLSGLPAARFPLVPLSAPLDAEQERLLGCGPQWGTVCKRSGIDLRNAEASVLIRSWPGGVRVLNGGTAIQVPGARSPYLPDGVPPTPAYDVDRDGTIDGLLIPPRFDPSAGQPFGSETAALSYNFVMLLIALSSGLSPHGSDPSAFDPSNPYALYDPSDPSTYSFAGQCSFSQPLYCSMIQALFDYAKPPPAAGGAPQFDRRDGPRTRQGCLPARSANALPLEGARRRGRCPPR